MLLMVACLVALELHLDEGYESATFALSSLVRDLLARRLL
jgi:hypothetical protein